MPGIADRGPVDRDRTGQDQGFQAGAGEALLLRLLLLRLLLLLLLRLLLLLCQDAVEPPAFLGGGDIQYLVPDLVGHEFCH